MTDRPALAALIKAVKTGTLKKQPYGGMPMLTAFHDYERNPNRIPGFSDGKAMGAYTGSVDAALALVKEVRPGWRARIDVGRRNRAWLISPDNRKLYAYADNPARALLLDLLLDLLRAMEADTGHAGTETQEGA